MFHVGQLVVCVDDGPSRRDNKPVALIKGQIYTIAAIHPELDWSNAFGIEVVECDVPLVWGRKGWSSTRFRPVTRRNIEIVESLLAPSPVKEMA